MEIARNEQHEKFVLLFAHVDYFRTTTNQENKSQVVCFLCSGKTKLFDAPLGWVLSTHPDARAFVSIYCEESRENLFLNINQISCCTELELEDIGTGKTLVEFTRGNTITINKSLAEIVDYLRFHKEQHII